MEMAFGLSCCSAALIVVSALAATDNATAVIVSFTYFMVSSRVVDWWLHNTQTLGVFGCEICPDCHSRLDQARRHPFPILPACGGGWGAGDGPEVKPVGDKQERGSTSL